MMDVPHTHIPTHFWKQVFGFFVRGRNPTIFVSAQFSVPGHISGDVKLYLKIFFSEDGVALDFGSYIK